MQKPNHPSRHPLRIRNPIRRQPLTQIARFADIQHALARAAHQIYSRSLWKCAKESIPKSLYERPRRIEQPKLTDSHSFTF
jgi:hypothetical protein